MKAFYDDYNPLGRDEDIVTQIENKLKKFLKEFYKDYQNQINDNFLDLMDQLKNHTSEWKKNIIQNPDLSV